jgi:hypothetical protein
MKLDRLCEREMVGNVPVVPSKGLPFPKGEAEKDFVAQGYQAKVFMPPNLQKSNAIVKVASLGRNPYNDSYMHYIHEILNDPNNPFFPRIYSAKVYLQNDRYYLVVVMEKLQPIRGNKIADAAEHLLAQLGIDKAAIRRSRKRQGQDTRLDKEDRVIDLSFDIGTMLRDEDGIRELIELSDNEQFKHAMETIMKVKNSSHDHRYDMHLGNWMVRLTGHGPQLVITDPLVTL